MLDALSSRWSTLALRGGLTILFGVLAIIWPGATALTLVLLFGTFAIADGILTGILAFSTQPPQPRWLLGLEAILGLLVGAMAVIRPGLTLMAVVSYLGIWAVIIGGLRIGQAISLRKGAGSEWLLVASGALAIVLGIVTIRLPVAGAMTLAWMIGLLAVAIGAAEIALAMRVRSLFKYKEAGSRLWSMRAEEQPVTTQDRIER